MSMSPCLGRLKSFLATSTPSRKRYCEMLVCRCDGGVGWTCLVDLLAVCFWDEHCCESLALFGRSHTMLEKGWVDLSLMDFVRFDRQIANREVVVNAKCQDFWHTTIFLRLGPQLSTSLAKTPTIHPTFKSRDRLYCTADGLKVIR